MQFCSYFIEEVRNAVNIPVLSIIEETVNFLNLQHITDVGILATSATIRNKLYEKKLKENGIQTHTPKEEDQSRMGDIINHLVLSKHTDKDKEKLIQIIDTFSSNEVKTIILACTDLQLLISERNNVKIYDTMKILAQATVREILK